MCVHVIIVFAHTYRFVPKLRAAPTPKSTDGAHVITHYMNKSIYIYTMPKTLEHLEPTLLRHHHQSSSSSSPSPSSRPPPPRRQRRGGRRPLQWVEVWGLLLFYALFVGASGRGRFFFKTNKYRKQNIQTINENTVVLKSYS